MFILDKVFDLSWKSDCLISVTNLNDVYKIPHQYDHFSKLNLKLEAPDKLNIEANKKFIIAGTSKVFDYYNTVNLIRPDKEFSYINKIYVYFENALTPDSIYLVISKSAIPGIFWNQIFYSSVRIENLGKFSHDPLEFRLNLSSLVSKEILKNNDSLINEVVHYFNINKDSLGLKECGTNSNIFKSICDKYSVPCRIVWLQGGDATEAGFNTTVGYPLHVVCEVYSSRYSKWYVIDPSYGSAYFYKDHPLNAVEISDKVFFSREKEIIEDSVLTTKQLRVNIDYFRYYENIFFDSQLNPNFLVRTFLKLFYEKFNYWSFLYSNKLVNTKNAREYFLIKSSFYLLITIVYINVIIIILTYRLLKSKLKN
jgi:hypothetical protein